MTGEFAVPAWLAVLVLLTLVASVAGTAVLVASVRRTRARTDEVLAAASAQAEDLRHHLADLEERIASERPATSLPAREDDPEYLITELGTPKPTTPMLPGPLFADHVARESMIRAASLVAGLRRALAPESRNRIRFEMKREVKRSRRQRRADVRQAVREWEARQREKVDA